MITFIFAFQKALISHLVIHLFRNQVTEVQKTTKEEKTLRLVFSVFEAN